MPRKALVPQELMRGPFSTAEAREAGLQRWHLKGNTWRRLTQGMYVLAEAESTISTLVAISKRFPRSAAVSGLTATWLHGIDVRPCDPIEITVPSHLGIYRPVGIRVRRSLLPDEHVARLHGLRVTSMARTVADISARLSLTEAVVIADAALHGRYITLEKLTEWAAANSRRPGSGIFEKSSATLSHSPSRRWSRDCEWSSFSEACQDHELRLIFTMRKAASLAGLTCTTKTRSWASSTTDLGIGIR
jgi:hypothetical protein